MSFLFSFKTLMVGFRKFLMGILFLLIAVVFRVFDLIDGAQFIDGTKTVVVAFFATNIGERMLDVGKDWIKKIVEKAKGK